MPSNAAAAKANLLEVKLAPYTSPGENEIAVKNGVVAMNLTDWAIQVMGEELFTWIKYPAVLDVGVAGEVVEVGSGMSRFHIGDRVVDHAVGLMSNQAAGGAFQKYTVLLAYMASLIPSTLSYESAAVLPLGLSNAACGLFQKDYLALQHPSMLPKPTSKAFLVWGGSTSVGNNAIQLAVAAGYEVFTTASPKEFDSVRKLGASQIFDDNSQTVVEEIIDVLKGKTFAGAFAIGNALAEGTGTAAAAACLEVVNKSDGVNSFPRPCACLTTCPAALALSSSLAVISRTIKSAAPFMEISCLRLSQ